MRPETEYCGGADVAQSQLDCLSQRKVAEQLTIKGTYMQTGRYMCGQKYTQSKNTPKLSVVYAYNVHSNNFPATISPALIHDKKQNN